MDSSHLESPHKGKTGLRRLWNAVSYSIDGLRAAYRHEDAFRQEVILAIFLIPLALLLLWEIAVRADLATVEIWVTALSCFAQPIPRYKPDDAHLLPAMQPRERVRN